MTVRFGGQSYTAQCPICDWELDWSGARGSTERVAAAVPQHEPGCPAVRADPARLRRASRSEAAALVAAAEAGRDGEG